MCEADRVWEKYELHRLITGNALISVLEFVKSEANETNDLRPTFTRIHHTFKDRSMIIYHTCSGWFEIQGVV